MISLPRLAARRRAIREHLTKHGVTKFEIVDAVDGANLSEEHKTLVSAGLTLKKIGRPMTNGEIGCALSHLLIYQRMVRENIREAIILEDDARICRDFVRLLSSGELPQSRINLLLFHSLKCDVLKFPIGEFKSIGHLFRPLSNPYGTMAYYLKLGTARRLLKKGLPVSCPADWPARVHLWPQVAVSYPFIAYPKPDHKCDSTIELERYNLMTNCQNNATPGRMGLGLLLFPRIIAPTIYGQVRDLPRDWFEFFLRKLSALVRATLGRRIGTDLAPTEWHQTLPGNNTN